MDSKDQHQGRAPGRLRRLRAFFRMPGSKLVGYSLEELEREFEVAVLLHRHGEAVRVHPPADAVLAEGDGFVVSAELDGLRRLATVTTPTRLLRRQAGAATGTSGKGSVGRDEP